MSSTADVVEILKRGPFTLFVKLIQRFLSKAQKRRINLTKRGDVREYTFASQKSSQKALP
jgi:hypothetical protein